MSNIENPANIPAQLKSHFLRLYQIALSDDNFSHLEMQLLYRFAEKRGINSSELDKILTGSVGEITIPETVEKRIEFLYDFAVMAWVDGNIADDELNTLKKYCLKFEFLEENVNDLADYLIESAKAEKSVEEILEELK